MSKKKKSNKHWYPRYSGDYGQKTSHLSLMQHGAYAMLLDAYYSTGKSLSASAPDLHRICRAIAPDEQAAVHSVLEQFFVLRDGRYYNERADEEIEKRNSISENRRLAQAAREAKRLAAKGASAPPSAHTATSTPTTISLELKPQTPLPVDNGDKSVNGRAGFKYENGGMGRKQPVDKSVYLDISLYLNERSLERAKKAAPGWDIYALIRKYNEGAEARGIPDNPPGAFIAWCGKYTKGKTP